MSTVKVLTKSVEQRYTLGVVYEPDSVDTQGDFAKAADIEAAAWDFMHRLQVLAKTGANLYAIVCSESPNESLQLEIDDTIEKGVGLDDQHLQLSEDLGTIVESYIAPVDMVIGDQAIKKGTWLLGVVWTPEMFDKIKKGERTGLSLYGTGDRVKV